MKVPQDDQLPSSQLYLDERGKLPEELRAQYDTLVKWYRYFATVHHSSPFASYKVLADLIRTGWRLSASELRVKQ